MTLLPLVGHHGARHRLARAWTQGRLPQVLLVTGPRGVGKQRLALWLAQLVLCEGGEAEPCGECRVCRMVAGLGHPDVHWIIPIARPKAGDPAKQVEEAAQSIAEAIAERRKTPLYAAPDGMAIHGVATARLVARHAALTPVEGRRKVFVIGEAERLVPQEASQEAANALLKLLEEPPGDTIFVLTAADPEALLLTVRSRAVPLRLSGIADEELREFLGAYVEPPLGEAELDERVRLADGSIGRGLWEMDRAATARATAASFLEAVLDDRLLVLERVLRQPPWSARGDFSDVLEAMGETLSDAARAALGHEPRRTVPRILRDRDPERLVQALGHVAEAQEGAAGNVNPQLLLAVLGERLGATL